MSPAFSSTDVLPFPPPGEGQGPFGEEGRGEGFDPSRPRDLWVVGDVHGAHDKLRALLMRAGLIDRAGNWTGGRAHLVFLGDYVDRGPDGVGVLRLVQQLERQARGGGGQVTALLGNHEVMFLAAALFRSHDPQDRLGFMEYWLSNGGQLWDLERLAPEDVTWIQSRPLLARASDWLLVHADSVFYSSLGSSLEDVNSHAADMLRSRDPSVWGAFANAFVDRMNFVGAPGVANARHLLERYGGQQLVHGHTPTALLCEHILYRSDDPTVPLSYASGLCVGADSGMAYFPDAGFIAQLGSPEWGEPQVQQVVKLPPGIFGAASFLPVL